MAERADSKTIVKHLADGTLDKLCLVCLNPLKEDNFESIFTLICKKDSEYCVADALEALCQFQIDGSENYNTCLDCYKSATEAYKFQLQAKQSMEIITHYTEELLNIIQSVKITNEDVEKLLCIPISEFMPKTALFDLNIDGIGKKYVDDTEDNFDDEPSNIDKEEIEITFVKDTESICDAGDDDNNDDFNNTGEKEIKMVFVNEDTELICDTELNEIDMENVKTSHSEGDEMSNVNSETDDEMVMIINEKKVRKKRDPMEYMTCSRCPIKYRFISKMKDHMKTKHDVDIFYCKICKLISEDKQEYEEHLKTHNQRGKFQCTICNAVYKREDTLIAHLKSHETPKHTPWSENANICEVCGAILADERQLQDHMASKHDKKYTCYYCGRMYKGSASFDSHIRKHEKYWDRKKGTRNEPVNKAEKDEVKNKRVVCQTCGNDFVNERALLWHQRLHNNDRPYTCQVCGRAFVSANRRNQHAVCAHTPPARRCPLCPALFHLRSMVNTHVKKVHLAAHKRRTRRSRLMNVFWRTQPVPIEDLSVDIQDDILEMKASLATAEMENDPASVENMHFDS